MVTLTYVHSGAERKTTTGPEGGFLFLQLSAGDYRVDVEAQGFAGKSQSR